MAQNEVLKETVALATFLPFPDHIGNYLSHKGYFSHLVLSLAVLRLAKSVPGTSLWLVKTKQRNFSLPPPPTSLCLISAGGAHALTQLAAVSPLCGWSRKVPLGTWEACFAGKQFAYGERVEQNQAMGFGGGKIIICISPRVRTL